MCFTLAIQILAIFLLGGCSSRGPLRLKADAYDKWNAEHHNPAPGGLVSLLFKDASYTEVKDYVGISDSCIWTGTYLGAQAFRYAVTNDPEAKTNMIRSVRALDGYLHITNTTGYIGRYWGLQSSVVYKSDEWCKKKGTCHKVTAGKYAGAFWFGCTTKDQYTGWFFGMGLAYEMLEDSETEVKKMIRDDVTEVVDTLIKNGWIIKDEKGQHRIISAGPRPTYVYQLSWLNVAYRVSGDKKYMNKISSRLTWLQMTMKEISLYAAYFNKYNQYYGNNLAHTSWYNLLRLGRQYYPKEAHERLKSMFSNIVHGIVRLSHNAWFTGIFMSQGSYVSTGANDPYKAQLIEDLSDFRPAPNYGYHQPAKKVSASELDPVTSWVVHFPWLRYLMSLVKQNYKPQARKAFPVRQQCFTDFLFQRSPYSLEACGAENKAFVHPGVDYLVSYWLARYHGFINDDA